MWVQLGIVIAQIVGGIVAAIIIGYSTKIFNRWDPKKTKLPKFFFLVLFSVGTPILCDLVGIPDAKFIFILVLGVVCFRMWGSNKPSEEMMLFWRYCQPCLFGTVGAAVRFSKIDPNKVGQGFAVIVIGVFARWVATFFAFCERKITNKERCFMAFSWMSKASVQAALGGMCLTKAKALGLKEYEEYGNSIITISVFSIVITAPLSAVLMDTFGTKWLEYDGTDPELLKRQGRLPPVPETPKKEDDAEIQEVKPEDKQEVMPEEISEEIQPEAIQPEAVVETEPAPVSPKPHVLQKQVTNEVTLLEEEISSCSSIKTNLAIAPVEKVVGATQGFSAEAQRRERLQWLPIEKATSKPLSRTFVGRQ